MDLAQLSSIGVKKIKVFKKIRVGIFSSGDELCEFPKKNLNMRYMMQIN